MIFPLTRIWAIRKNQRGVTFIEVLGVLVILVQLYLIYSHSFTGGMDKAKLSTVQQHFRQYQAGFETAMTENSGLPSTNGINTDYSKLNNYIDKSFQITSPAMGTGSTHPTANPIQTTNMKDPWGNSYQVQAKYVSPQESLLIVRSAGIDRLNTVTNDLFYDTQATTDTDDMILVSDFKNGTVKSCTKGLSKNLGAINNSGAGATLPTGYYDYTNATTRQTMASTYAYEYVVDVKENGTPLRTYVFSNSPLNLSPYVNGIYVNVKEATNQTYAGFKEWWWEYDYNDNPTNMMSTSPSTFTNGTLSDILNDDGFTSIDHITNISSQSTPNTILGCN